MLALPSVSDVLALPELRAGRPSVVAGTTGLDEPVRWIHAAEITDIAHLLAGGELVLTTGIALPEDARALADYVDTLADAHVTGLAVELVQRWTQPPAALVEAAERRELPLIALRNETRFVAVTEAVAALIRDAQLAELREAERIHESFTALTVSGAEPGDVLAEVAASVLVPTVLETLSHDVLGYDAAGTDPEPLLAGWQERSAAVTLDRRTGYHEQSGWLVTVVGARGDDWGRLVMLTGAPPAHRHVVVAERAASALAVNRLVSKERDTLERQSHARMLTAILTQRRDPDELAAQAAALGVPLTDTPIVGLAARPGVAGTGAAAVSIRQALRDVAESAARAARHEGIPALVAATDNTTVHALLAPRRSDVDATVDRVAREIHRSSRRHAQPLPVTVGAGTTVHTPADATRTLAEATHVARAVADDEEHRDCHRLTDVHLPGLLHQLREDERLTSFAERELAALRDDPALLDALRHFCEHGGNKSAAAAAAHVSRSTYYARLSRVQRLLGGSLDDPRTVLSLHVALLARDLRAVG